MLFENCMVPWDCICICNFGSYFYLWWTGHFVIQDYSDPAQLLSKGNIDKKALEQYARESTNYATEGQLKDLPFEKNHRGENDVALFDFTSLFKSENAARIIERKGKCILLCLAGDSLLEVSDTVHFQLPVSYYITN